MVQYPHWKEELSRKDGGACNRFGMPKRNLEFILRQTGQERRTHDKLTNQGLRPIFGLTSEKKRITFVGTK